MSFRLSWLLLIFALPLSSAIGAGAQLPGIVAERPPSDEAAMQLMRGYWILAKRAPDTSAVVVSLVLEASGRITLEEDYKNEDGGQLRVILKGKWWVKDGVAYGDFTETSHPDIAPLYKTRDTILHLDDRAMELRTKDGEFERWERNVG